MKRLNQLGDTIIEVLICLAILGASLGTAYALSTRSLNGNRASQERGEALKLAQTQIEELRAYASNTANAATWSSATGVAQTGHSYCMTNSGGVAVAAATAQVNPVAESDTFPSTAYNSACSNLNGLYNVSISYYSAEPDVFVVRVRWPALGGSGHKVDELIQYYRLYHSA
ncbi:MAG: hypothetical protein JWS12_414 [Candidatus Saccharibacteria bacterium]|nr:hypothetical protein [Candidatus Saccharibacteria bacterium]